MAQELLTPQVVAKTKKAKRQGLLGSAMIFLPMAGFILFSLLPIVLCLITSFNHLIGIDISNMTPVGIENYIRVFRMSDFRHAVKNTLLYTLIVAPIETLSCTFFACLIAKGFKGSKIARVILFLPQVCSSVAIVFVFQWIFQEDFGVINSILSPVLGENLKFFTDAKWYRVAVFVMSLWLKGTNVIILDSAFANVDKSLQEAARMDGASEFKVFWKVTFPCVTPALFYVFTMYLISALQEQSIMMFFTPTNPYGPEAAGITLTILIYLCAFGDKLATYGMGVSCAMSWVTALIIVIITRINFYTSKFWVHYEC